MAERPKSVENLITHAFAAGVKAAVGFPAMNAIPERHLENALQKFKDDWIGRPELPDRCSSCGSSDPRHVEFVRDKGVCVV